MVSVYRAALRLHPGYATGRIYATWAGDMVVTVAVPAADVLYLYPFPIYAPVTVENLHLRTATGGAGSAGKCGIWADSPVSHRPLGAPLLADNVGQATTGNNATTTANVTDATLAPGWYWAGSKFQATLPTMYSIQSSRGFSSFFAGGASPILVSFSIASAYGADLPTLAEGASFTEHTGGGTPGVWMGT